VDSVHLSSGSNAVDLRRCRGSTGARSCGAGDSETERRPQRSPRARCSGVAGWIHIRGRICERIQTRQREVHLEQWRGNVHVIFYCLLSDFPEDSCLMSLSAPLCSSMRALSIKTTGMGVDSTAGPQATRSLASSISTEKKDMDNKCCLKEPPLRLNGYKYKLHLDSLLLFYIFFKYQ